MMSNGAPSPQSPNLEFTESVSHATTWHTFPQILHRLHQERIFIHPEQLAEFMVMHGLPVDLEYVPNHLKQKADQINTHYQGDLAQLEAAAQPAQMFLFE
jgi:hypothetical protein